MRVKDVRKKNAMRAVRSLAAALAVVVVFASPAVAQSPVGALAVDERQGDQWGWAVDYETASAARAAALRECGAGCSVVLTFARCGAYAADQDSRSTVVGWAESYASADGARQRSLAECRSRGGSGCTVRVWGCNGPVIEEGLGLNQAARRQVQQGLRAAGFDPGGADGLFGPRTRTAIRSWQSARGVRPTGYLDGSQGRSLARQKRIPTAGGGGCHGHRCRWAGSRVLAVDPEQHESGGVRGVSGAVPERGVPGAGAGPAGSATWFDGRCHHDSPAGW